jgi:hypothetical protein
LLMKSSLLKSPLIFFLLMYSSFYELIESFYSIFFFGLRKYEGWTFNISTPMSWRLQHRNKSIFACIQVTSQSTKAPLYSATSLVYKWKLFFRGAVHRQKGRNYF